MPSQIKYPSGIIFRFQYERVTGKKKVVRTLFYFGNL